METIDAHLIAIDAKNGRPLWDTTVASARSAYSITHAPLVIKDKVIVGTGGGEYGIRGFLAAYDARTGKEVWRFNTVRDRANLATKPGEATPGRPGAPPYG